MSTDTVVRSRLTPGGRDLTTVAWVNWYSHRIANPIYAGSTPVATSKENKMGLDMNAYKVKPDSWW